MSSTSYYTVGDSVQGLGTQRIHVLSGSTDSNNPMGPYTYVTQMQPPNWNDFQIDGSILQFGDSLYLLFSGSTATSPQSIYITPMSDPVTISGDAVMISTPTLPFVRLIYYKWCLLMWSIFTTYRRWSEAQSMKDLVC